MFQVDEFFQRFVKWVLYKYWNVFLQNEDRFFQFIKENFSADDKKTDRKFLEETFIRFKAYESNDAKKNLREILTQEFKHNAPQQVNHYDYQALERILLSIFKDKSENNLGVYFLFHAAITGFPVDQCLENEALKEELFTQDPEEEGGFTPLHWAVFCGSSDFIKSCMKITDNEFLSDLLKVKDEDGKTSFQRAIDLDNVSVIRAFKKDGVTWQKFAEWNTYGKPLLYYVLENNARKFAEFILPKINLNAFPNGSEAIYAAVRSGNIELIEVVLPYCPNFSDLNSQFRTVIGEAIQRIKQLRRQKKLVAAENKRELDEDIKNLVTVIQYFLEKDVTPTYSEQHYIKRYVDKGVIPLNDNNIKEIVDNYKKEVRLKTFLSTSILLDFLLAGKGAQFLGAAADAGQISGAGLSLVGISIILAMTTFGLIVTPREKILIGLAALKALPRKVRNAIYRWCFGPSYSSESYELTPAEENKLFCSPEDDSTLIIRCALESAELSAVNEDGQIIDLETEEEKKENTVITDFSDEFEERLQRRQQAKYPDSSTDSDSDSSDSDSESTPILKYSLNLKYSLKEEEDSSETKLDIEETKPDTSPEYGFP